MEEPKIITISELLQRSRPLTGASSLNSSSSSSSIPSHGRQKASNSSPTTVSVESLTGRNPKLEILESLKYPTLIIGNLELPVYDNSDSDAKSRFCSSKNGCFSFSDGLSRVCCDVLDLDVKILGKRIHVLSWNFIPFKCGGGFLEIISWSLPVSLGMISGCSTVPEEQSEALRFVHGILKSVSPVYVVPCTVQNRKSQNNTDGNGTDSRNTSGFLAEIMVCKCKFFSSMASVKALQDPRQRKYCHSFCVAVVVYFLGSSCSWHPAISKLVSNVVCVTGLKKKLVSTVKNDSCLMFITTGKSALHMMSLSSPQEFPSGKTIIKGKGESGGYSGVVTGVYMQGMVVELDENVWISLTDPLLAPPHSMRIGAFVTLKNVHFVHPKFPWTRMLLLGTCFRTNIKITSFSPLQSQCYIRSQRQSLLSIFADSLVFSARFWLLLTVSCFKRIFSRIFSEEEILGSKHMFVRCQQKKGLVQMYVTSCLPSCLFQPRHGVFMEFCKHDMCCCGIEPDYDTLKLVVPISNFISRCETMWVGLLLKMQNEPGMVGNNSSIFCGGKSFCRMIRRILSSEDIGIALMGTLQISTSSGRMQLIDATGSIDVVIPDFPLHCDVSSVYEIRNYSVVMEGLPAEVGALGLHKSEPFSCRSILHHVLPKKEIKPTAMYAHFYLRDATCLSGSIQLPSVKDGSDNLSDVKDGIFHLILITHKFPTLQNVGGDPLVSKKSGLFAEAIILPWQLDLPGEHGEAQVTEAPEVKLKEQAECDPPRNYRENIYKRPKLGHASENTSHSGLRNNKVIAGCGSPDKIPCMVCVRRSNDHKPDRLGFLLNTSGNGVINKSSCRKVLLEFKSDSYIKYQLVRVGVYYMLKYAKDDPLYNVIDCGRGCGDKVLVISQTPWWSFSFSCDEVLSSELPRDHALQIASARNIVVPSESSNSEVLFQSFPSQFPENTDVNLHISADAINLLKVEIDALKEGSMNLITISGEAPNISTYIGTTTTVDLQSSVLTDPDCRLPRGNLISVHGHVLDVHSIDCNSVVRTGLSCEGIVDIHQLRLFQGVHSICIHVSEGHHIVRIRGTVSKHTYPIGMGAGVTATFHRVLVLGQHDLMLTPVSFIVINSIKEVSHNYSDRGSCPWFGPDILNGKLLDTVSSGLISDFIHYQESKSLRLRCRVVAIHILVLEKNKYKFEKEQTKKFKAHSVNISVAGFILDDGSSLCCCWADAERAATLLRLHEETPIKALSNSRWRWKSDRPVETQISASHHLEKILDKHPKVTIRNNGASIDSSCQDFTITLDSDDMLSSSDNNFLQFISLNACCGPVFSIVGSMVESNDVRQFMEFKETEITRPSLPNIWAREVQYINPRSEANNMIQELL